MANDNEIDLEILRMKQRAVPIPSTPSQDRNKQSSDDGDYQGARTDLLSPEAHAKFEAMMLKATKLQEVRASTLGLTSSEADLAHAQTRLSIARTQLEGVRSEIETKKLKLKKHTSAVDKDASEIENLSISDLTKDLSTDLEIVRSKMHLLASLDFVKAQKLFAIHFRHLEYFVDSEAWSKPTPMNDTVLMSPTTAQQTRVGPGKSSLAQDRRMTSAHTSSPSSQGQHQKGARDVSVGPGPGPLPLHLQQALSSPEPFHPTSPSFGGLNGVMDPPRNTLVGKAYHSRSPPEHDRAMSPSHRAMSSMSFRSSVSRPDESTRAVTPGSKAMSQLDALDKKSQHLQDTQVRTNEDKTELRFKFLETKELQLQAEGLCAETEMKLEREVQAIRDMVDQQIRAIEDLNQTKKERHEATLREMDRLRSELSQATGDKERLETEMTLEQESFEREIKDMSVELNNARFEQEKTAKKLQRQRENLEKQAREFRLKIGLAKEDVSVSEDLIRKSQRELDQQLQKSLNLMASDQTIPTSVSQHRGR